MYANDDSQMLEISSVKLYYIDVFHSWVRFVPTDVLFLERTVASLGILTVGIVYINVYILKN
jgi:hypothetical protein